ncbi:3-oxoacyl-[acyl-carrier protein] reductase [Bacteroides luti]|uniref:3-oxoacyl-[acyl-carrier protein] reductase n=1 Tax=Bacteroides luti TaxID=1297750 RepID=A0A1M4WHT8_9BACE|nr:SDR family oxidoreductase [Bacteroides luti]SHE80747.1 3-oxoacyl-[acyl-carrier protein] reductase [Bacteroides luti]
MKEFLNKVVCITGSNRGIGKELAITFANEGANLILCSREENPESTEFYKELASRYKITVYPCYFDLESDESIKKGLSFIKSLKIKIDILVNNAGIPHLAILPFTRISDARRVFQVNYFAQLMITQSLLSIMTKTGGAAIINMASIAGIDGDIGNCVYGATKASMILFTKVLAKEVANSKIRVNAVAPGLTDTDFAITMGDKAITSMKEISTMHRLGTAHEISNAVLFLASDRASFINGQVLRVDGYIK